MKSVCAADHCRGAGNQYDQKVNNGLRQYLYSRRLSTKTQKVAKICVLCKQWTPRPIKSLFFFYFVVTFHPRARNPAPKPVPLVRPMNLDNVPEIQLVLTRVTLSGNCTPSCSSPSTTGMINPGLRLLTCGAPSGRANSNCLMRVTKNVCISKTLGKGIES